MNGHTGRVDVTHFKQVAGRWASGCAVVTTVTPDGEMSGVTMSAVTSLSLDPMQFLICVDKRSRTLEALRESGRFVINMLAKGQRDVALRFASKVDDKFAATAYRMEEGLPVLDGTLGHVRCEAVRILDGGDHEIVIGEVHAVTVSEGEPLVHYRGGFGQFLPVAA